MVLIVKDFRNCVRSAIEAMLPVACGAYDRAGHSRQALLAALALLTLGFAVVIDCANLHHAFSCKNSGILKYIFLHPCHYTVFKVW